MPSSLAAGDGRRRYLIATGVTTGLSAAGAQRIAESVNKLVGLAVAVFGYERVTSLALDPTADQLRRSIHNFCAERGPDDVVLIYHTGHADLTTEREHRLWMGDTQTGSPAELLRTKDIAEMALSGTRVGNLLFALDTCYAARGNAEAAHASLTWLEREGQRMFVLMSAAHPLEQIEPGQFPTLLERAVHHQASGGTEPQYLHADVLANHMMGDVERPPSQTISSTKILAPDRSEIFFPNPRYDPTISGRDEYFKQQQEQTDKRRREMYDHFAPRGRGVENASEHAWRFVGRHAALQSVSGWLNGDNGDPRSRIVTGRPGSGKSALLGRLVLLSDKELRGSVPLAGVPTDTIPHQGTIDVAVHARSKTTTEVREALAYALGIRDRCDSVGDLLHALRNRSLCAVVDAVDEAIDQHDLVRNLLRPLIVDGPEFGLRLLVGTRAHLLDELRPGAVVLDLDTPTYSDRQSVVAYSELNLRETDDESPYREADPDLVHAVADAVAERANLSFLVAMIVSRTLAATPTIPDPTDQYWRRSLPSTAAQAMAHDLDTRLRPVDATKVRDLLTPLAFAYGAGLPWENIWVPLVNRITGGHYTNADVLWLRRTAGSYLVETREAERSAYRLYHEALAEHVREVLPAAKVHSAVLDFFVDYCTTPRGRRRWEKHNYVSTHLSTHAAAAGRLAELTDDPAFLIVAEQSNLLAAFGSGGSPDLAATAAVYQLASHHLRDKPYSERASYLELTAHKAGATRLASNLRSLSARGLWSTKWAKWKVENPHRILHAHNGWVTSIARLPARGTYRDMVVSCSDDGTIRFWDVRKGIADGSPLYGHNGQVFAIDVVDLPEQGMLLVVSAGGDHTVRVWDVALRRQRGAPLTGHRDKVHLVACASAPGRRLVFSADRSGGLRVWDLLDQRPIEHPLNRHVGQIPAMTVLTQASGSLLVVATGSDLTDRSQILVFDAPTGNFVSQFNTYGLARSIHQTTPNSFIVVTDDRIAEYTLQGLVLKSFPHHHTDRVVWSSYAKSPRGAPLVVTTSANGTIRTFDLQRQREATPPLSGSHRHSMSAVHMFLDANRTMVVSGNNDGTLRLWDVNQYLESVHGQTGDQIRSIILDNTQEDTHFYTAGGNHIRKWRLRDGLNAGVMGPTASPIVTMAGAPVSERYDEHKRSWWKLTKQTPMPLIVADKRGGLYCLRKFDSSSRFPDPVNRSEVVSALAHFGMTLQRNVLIASGHESGTIRCLEINLESALSSRRHEAGKPRHLSYLSVPKPAAGITLSHRNSQQILVGAGDGSIHLWNHRTGEKRRTTRIHSGPVTALALEGNILASAADDRRIVLWDIDTQEPLRELDGQHTRHIHTLTWLPPNVERQAVLISGGVEGLLRCWQVCSTDNQTPKVSEPLIIEFGAQIRALAAGPDRTVIIGTDHGIAVIKLTGL